MKNFLLIVTFLVFGIQSMSAQDRDKKIEALKIAFLTEKLQLSPSEAKEFWPVYNNYQKEVQNLRSDARGGDVLENEQKLLDIRKKYKPSFEKILGAPKVNTLYNSEKEFRNILIKRLKNQQRGNQPL
ncbi:MAG: hypothetical protein J0H55_03715 [Chitinophagaceae bacterium]|nr:hypothetical protein [Chitinophagaceae bacterium]